MMKRIAFWALATLFSIILVILLVGAYADKADAATRYHHHRHHIAHHHRHRHHHKRHVHRVAGIYRGYIPGRWVCARNLGNWQRSHGFRAGNNLARSYFQFPRVPRESVTFGDVWVAWRKGRASDGTRGAHVMAFLEREGPKLLCRNPGSHGWKVRDCPVYGEWVRPGRA